MSNPEVVLAQASPLPRLPGMQHGRADSLVSLASGSSMLGLLVPQTLLSDINAMPPSGPTPHAAAAASCAASPTANGAREGKGSPSASATPPLSLSRSSCSSSSMPGVDAAQLSDSSTEVNASQGKAGEQQQQQQQQQQLAVAGTWGCKDTSHGASVWGPPSSPAPRSPWSAQYRSLPTSPLPSLQPLRGGADPQAAVTTAATADAQPLPATAGLSHSFDGHPSPLLQQLSRLHEKQQREQCEQQQQQQQQQQQVEAHPGFAASRAAAPEPSAPAPKPLSPETSEELRFPAMSVSRPLSLGQHSTGSSNPSTPASWPSTSSAWPSLPAFSASVGAALSSCLDSRASFGLQQQQEQHQTVPSTCQAERVLHMGQHSGVSLEQLAAQEQQQQQEGQMMQTLQQQLAALQQQQEQQQQQQQQEQQQQQQQHLPRSSMPDAGNDLQSEQLLQVLRAVAAGTPDQMHSFSQPFPAPGPYLDAALAALRSPQAAAAAATTAAYPETLAAGPDHHFHQGGRQPSSPFSPYFKAPSPAQLSLSQQQQLQQQDLLLLQSPLRASARASFDGASFGVPCNPHSFQVRQGDAGLVLRV